MSNTVTGIALSERERQIAIALADAVIPPGAKIPGGGNDQTINRFESIIQSYGDTAAYGFKAFLWALESYAMGRYLKSFSTLDHETRCAMLESWAEGDIGRRASLRIATIPLKIAHFNSAAMFDLLDCKWQPRKASPETARWRSQIMTGDDLDPKDTEFEADVIVVGTGAGGAVVAKELAAQGWAVMMVEEGRHFDRSDFTSKSRLELQNELYRGGGMLATVGNTAIPLLVGKSLGGTTTVNSGTCFRAPDKILNHWHKKLGLSEFSPQSMARHYERVEHILGVEPASWDYLGGVAEVVRDGCERLGYSHHPLSRNAPGCDGQGVCCFGCPTDAKSSTNVSYVPLALQNHATCLIGAKVTKILLKDKKAVGVEARVQIEGGLVERKVTIRAPYVVLACGTVYTPLLLLENGLCNKWDQVGRHLTIHPACGINALYEHDIRGWDAIPQGYCIDEFKDDGVLFEGAFVPLEMATAAFPIIGKDFTEAMEAYNQMAIFGFMISDTSQGRVRRGLAGRPLITYQLNQEDVLRLQWAAEILGRVYFASGAKRLYAPIFGHEIINNEDELMAMATAKLSARDFELSAYHPLGTCRIGADPRTSITNDQHETHEVGNLFICDGSSVPSSLGVNPQITIMAMATRFSELLNQRMQRERK
ncbi:MAG TPA: GMC oxidoreductase [Myxococcales bacterium]|nr:GMC oxidoreductase [Myxococcales bacterium]HIN85745.1 GMC oxidoreductase [Myxococcales bacterium]